MAILAVSTPIKAGKNKKGEKRLLPITIQWHRTRNALLAPLGYSMAEIYWDAAEIGEARCGVARLAKQREYKYLFFLDWDVLTPQNALVKLVYHAENNPEFYVFSGVYCLKRNPAEPLLWKDEIGKGVTWDWKVGDILKDIVGVGMGCALIRMSVFDKLSEPWFKWTREYVSNEAGGKVSHTEGEDLYFCRKLKEETGTSIFVDTSIQCIHIDNSTGEMFRLPKDSYPCRP
jgi:hypothetical protein